MAKILVYDIETTGFKADFDWLLCIGYMWLDDEKPTVLKITDYPGYSKDPTNDKKLVQDFMKIYNQADVVVNWYGSQFDKKFLNAKIFEYNLDVPPNTAEQDLYFNAKRNFAVSRRSLANMAYYGGIGSKHGVDGKTWRKARGGHKPSIDAVAEHCYQDIILTKDMYLKMRPWSRQHPRVAGWLPCRVCGSDKIQRRGTATSVNKGQRWRFQCQSCGSWENRSEQHTEDTVAATG